MMVVENMTIGRTSCDYVNTEEWLQVCRKWLQGDKFRHVVTLNPEMVMMANLDERFNTQLNRADIRVPDGAGLIWARWYLRSRYWPLWPSLLAFLWQPVERVTGVDAVSQLAELCAINNKSIYLLGGQQEAVEALAEKLQAKYPGLRVAVSPEHIWEEHGPGHVVDHIREFEPAVLLAAYGAPKQTIWLEAQRGKLPSVRIGVGVGGAFDILSEQLPRAPLALRKMNMEWVWRLYLEPGRWSRIWQAVVKFPMLVSKQKKQQVD